MSLGFLSYFVSVLFEYVWKLSLIGLLFAFMLVVNEVLRMRREGVK